MTDRKHILIDATLESQAPFFNQHPTFQPWLHSFNNIPEALEFISKIESPYNTVVYLARNNVFDHVPPSDETGQIPTLIQVLSDSRIIHHVVIFCPGLNTEHEDVFRKTLPDRRLVKDVISVVSLHCNMCVEGIKHFENEKNRCLSTQEAHLTPNLTRSEDDLMEYLKKLIDDRKQILTTLVEEHFNRPGEEAL